jgi:hypothetical protein
MKEVVFVVENGKANAVVVTRAFKTLHTSKLQADSQPAKK